MMHPEAGIRFGDGGPPQASVCRRGARQRETGRAKGDLLLVGRWVSVWLFTVYDKDEMADLTAEQRKALKGMIKAELEARRT